MIPRFTDHAANERTYLAWVRTAIAIMAFGFLIERFDLFLLYAVRGGVRNSPIAHLHTSEWVGLLLIVFGALIIGLATLRFLRHRQAIASAETLAYDRGWGERGLALLLVCLGLFLIVYVGQQVLAFG